MAADVICVTSVKVSYVYTQVFNMYVHVSFVYIQVSYVYTQVFNMAADVICVTSAITIGKRRDWKGGFPHLVLKAEIMGGGGEIKVMNFRCHLCYDHCYLSHWSSLSHYSASARERAQESYCMGTLHIHERDLCLRKKRPIHTHKKPVESKRARELLHGHPLYTCKRRMYTTKETYTHTQKTCNEQESTRATARANLYIRKGDLQVFFVCGKVSFF